MHTSDTLHLMQGAKMAIRETRVPALNEFMVEYGLLTMGSLGLQGCVCVCVCVCV